MHALCVLLGHRYNTSADYDNATNRTAYLYLSCTRCGKLLTNKLYSEPTESATPTTQRKPRTKKPATINP